MPVSRMLLTSVVAAALAGCASGAQVAALSEPSPDPTTSVLTGSPTGPSPRATAGSHRSQGTIVGEYRLVGGPAPGVNQPEPATIWVYAGHVDLSQMSHAKVAAHTNTDGSGHFTLSLDPGAYALFGSQGLSSSVATDGCGVPVSVQVKASTRTTIDLACSVP
jgi:hypothetical protein